MAKKDLVNLECDFCGNYDTIDVRESAEKVMPIISRWKGVMDGDAPPGQADSHRWYDSLDCLVAGEQKHERAKQVAIADQVDRDRKLAAANEALKNSAFMKDAVKQ